MYQKKAVYGIFYPDNKAAYSALFLFETIGLILGSILSIFLCVNAKIYVFIGLIFVCIVTYVLLEVRGKISKANTEDSKRKTQKETTF